ncbi:hypothetical protein Gotur_007069 [Gossypium turneri]
MDSTELEEKDDIEIMSRSLKKVCIRETEENLDIVMDITPIVEKVLSWRDRLVGIELRADERITPLVGANGEGDFEISKNDIACSLVNGILKAASNNICGQATSNSDYGRATSTGYYGPNIDLLKGPQSPRATQLQWGFYTPDAICRFPSIRTLLFRKSMIIAPLIPRQCGNQPRPPPIRNGSNAGGPFIGYVNRAWEDLIGVAVKASEKERANLENYDGGPRFLFGLTESKTEQGLANEIFEEVRGRPKGPERQGNSQKSVVVKDGIVAKLGFPYSHQVKARGFLEGI